jgi:hypothetical protein
MGHDGKDYPAPIIMPNRILRLISAGFCCLALLAGTPARADGYDDAIDSRSPTPLTPSGTAGYAGSHQTGYVTQGSGSESAELADESSSDAAAASTGTAVGQKVQALRSDLSGLESSVASEASQLQSLRASTQANASDYFNSTAAIDAKLQVGTTKGNPILVSQLTQAQAKLDTLSADVGSFNALSTEVAQSASQAAFMLESVRATYGLSGAVDEDHVALGLLEDDVNREVVKIDRLLNEISGDLSRQSTYVATERRNLQTLSLAVSNGEMYGQSLANRPYMTASAVGGGMGGGSSASSGIPSGTRPLVVIRFERDNVDYQNAVYQAVSQALDKYPQAYFTVMAVSPTGANAAEGALASSDAKRNADGVARTLSQMGVASGRIQLSQATSAGLASTEVRIYVH